MREGLVGHVKCDIFPFTVIVVVGEFIAPEVHAEVCRACHPCAPPVDLEWMQAKEDAIFQRKSAHGHHASLCGGMSLIWVCNPNEPEILAHEAFHASVRLLKFAGLKLNSDSEEAYAYTLSWILDSVHKGLLAFWKEEEEAASTHHDHDCEHLGEG